MITWLIILSSSGAQVEVHRGSDPSNLPLRVGEAALSSEGWTLGPWLPAWVIMFSSFRFRIGSLSHMLRNWKMAKLKNKWPLKYWRAFTLEKNVIPFPGTFHFFYDVRISQGVPVSLLGCIWWSSSFRGESFFIYSMRAWELGRLGFRLNPGSNLL